MSLITPLPMAEIVRRASRGVGKIDLYGPRGVTMLSSDEAEAMALLLARLGLVPSIPGKPAPEAFFITSATNTLPEQSGDSPQNT